FLTVLHPVPAMLKLRSNRSPAFIVSSCPPLKLNVYLVTVVVEAGIVAVEVSAPELLPSTLSVAVTGHAVVAEFVKYAFAVPPLSKSCPEVKLREQNTGWPPLIALSEAGM